MAGVIPNQSDALKEFIKELEDQHVYNSLEMAIIANHRMDVRTLGLGYIKGKSPKRRGYSYHNVAEARKVLEHEGVPKGPSYAPAQTGIFTSVPVPSDIPQSVVDEYREWAKGYPKRPKSNNTSVTPAPDPAPSHNEVELTVGELIERLINKSAKSVARATASKQQASTLEALLEESRANRRLSQSMDETMSQLLDLMSQLLAIWSK